MASQLILALCLMVAIATAIPQTGDAGWAGGWGAAGWGNGAANSNPWIPPWISSAPWYPQWSACTTIGASCVDCNTKIVCTKIGGLQRACTDPTLPYCNVGECSSTPSEECVPVNPPVSEV